MLTVDFDKLEFKPGFRVLDAGCGTGRHITEAFRRKGVDVVGIDMKLSDLTKAKDTLGAMMVAGESGGGEVLMSVSDITKLPFADDTFDIVICSEVMEHIPGHELAAGELIRILKPGHALVVSVPRYFPERICWALSEEYHTTPGDHVRIYKKRELKRILERRGVKVEDSGRAHALHSPYWWLKCLVGPKNDEHPAVKLYHRFLVWDIMEKPWITRTLDRILNPFISKSIVLYMRKGNYYGA